MPRCCCCCCAALRCAAHALPGLPQRWARWRSQPTSAQCVPAAAPPVPESSVKAPALPHNFLRRCRLQARCLRSCPSQSTWAISITCPGGKHPKRNPAKQWRLPRRLLPPETALASEAQPAPSEQPLSVTCMDAPMRALHIPLVLHCLYMHATMPLAPELALNCSYPKDAP